MSKSFADRIEDNARLGFKLDEAEQTINEQIEKINASNASAEFKSQLIEMIKNIRSNFLKSVAMKEIFRDNNSQSY
ncbi:hypothetical protein [Pedobacter agri]|uniref:hypothetical protein n=1 Tax=Pedobacter agri TaxID=454586 RepID=UPI00292DF9DC|nr:hypothetical protein [Pedobacter agri]